jgi:methionine biosynthesis protein MetW
LSDKETIKKESKEKVYANLGNDDVLNMVPPAALYILDIGCGDGSTARQLIRRNCIVDGITISENEKKQAEKTMRQVYVHNLENGLPFAGTDLYDAVICSHVLEHICYPERMMNDIYRVLKSNGVFIVALPNIMHYRSRWSLVQGNFNYQEAGIWDFTHFRWYTYASAKLLLEQHNFRIEVATVTGTLPLYSIFKKIFPSAVNRFLYTILIKISKGFFGYQLLYRSVKTG